jgi:hypothetical protein
MYFSYLMLADARSDTEMSTFEVKCLRKPSNVGVKACQDATAMSMLSAVPVAIATSGSGKQPLSTNTFPDSSWRTTMASILSPCRTLTVLHVLSFVPLSLLEVAKALLPRLPGPSPSAIRNCTGVSSYIKRVMQTSGFKT